MSKFVTSFKRQISKTSANFRILPLLSQDSSDVEESKYSIFLSSLIHHLGTCLATPEEEIIHQGDIGNDLFFISKGDCAVFFTDTYGKAHLSDKLLTEGDHFGEVALIYKCKRTMTVMSRNYNTMARLSYDQYRNIINEFTEFQDLLKAYLFEYNDVGKQFATRMLLSIEFFQDIRSSDVFHSLIYRMKETIHMPGEIILRQDD